MLLPHMMNILTCPSCNGELQTNALQDELCCQKCGLVFPVRDGIPVLLIDQATERTGGQ